MRKTLKSVLIKLAAMILFLAVAGAIFIARAEKNLKALAGMPVEDNDLSAVPDGTYHGSYSAFPVAVELQVTAEDNEITAIDLIKHRTGQGQAAEALPKMVIEAQSLQVDTISGATYSSKVILLAIKDALTTE